MRTDLTLGSLGSKSGVCYTILAREKFLTLYCYLLSSMSMRKKVKYISRTLSH